MSVGYAWVQWSKHKRVYDATMAGAALAYVAGFVVVSKLLWRSDRAISDEIVVLRALGSCAFVLLTIILCIGPMARLERRVLPILYNRRHLGVMTFLIALVHGVIAVGYYHGFGVLNPLVSLLATNTNYGSLRAFPFQTLGLLALAILFLMAATSHDFWLKNLSASTWKGLHMLVYPAYFLLVGHVGLGALQAERGMVGAIVVGVGVVLVASLHLIAGVKEVRKDAWQGETKTEDERWIDVGEPGDIPEDRARTVCAKGERIAVFKSRGKISAVTNVCAHQGGPLGEGRIIDGCVTCPWHGWQYRAQDGCSPPPFEEKIATYQVRIVKGRVQVSAKANAPGTAVEPAVVENVAEEVGRG